MPPNSSFISLAARLWTELHRGHILRPIAELVSLKVGGILLALLGSVLYARMLGPEGYGLYSFVIATVAILTIPASLGLPNYLVREGAKELGSPFYMVRWADRRVVFAGLVAAAILLCTLLIPVPEKTRWLFLLASPLPLINSLSGVRTSLLQAKHYVMASQWPQLLLAPVLTILIFGGLWFLRHPPRAEYLIIAVLASSMCILGIKTAQTYRLLRQNDAPSKPNSLLNIGQSMPLMWLAALYLLNSRVDLILVTSFKGEHDAGIYAIGSRTAELITIISAAANMHLAPKVAHLYHQGEMTELKQVLRQTAARYLIATAPVVAFFLLFGKPLITTIYGAAYLESAAVLRILSCAQFGFLIFGSVGTILIMTDNIKYCLQGVAAALAVNVLLNVLLIPDYGVRGAAFSTGASMVLGQLLLWLSIRKHTHLRSSALGL